MEKNEGSPEKSSSEQDLCRRSPPRPSSGGSGSQNLPAGGSSSSSNPPEGQRNLPSVRANQGMIRPSVLMAVPLPPRPLPTRFILAPPRFNAGKGVAVEPISGKTQSNTTGSPPGGPVRKIDSELVSRALSSTWPVPGPSHKGRERPRKLKEQPPRCTTCGQTFRSWNGLFGHMRSHADSEYLGALPPTRASRLNRENGFQVIDLRRQTELVNSLINAATVVSAMLNHVESSPKNGMQIGGCSEAGTSTSGVPKGGLNNPDENRRSLRNDGLLPDLNAPPPDSDSDVEDPK